MFKPKIIAITGPTASGKSALAVRLCELYGGEVISCDSMQIYRRMDIGTAKPTVNEMGGIVHRMIDIAEPDEDFSCADYVRVAKEEVENVLAKGKVPIFCGGTGLYLDAFLRGSDFGETKIDASLRRELEKYAEENGNEALHSMLREIDPESADAIHPNNVKRVIRAIEIYRTGGKTKSELDRESQLSECDYDALVIGLRYRNREILYDRIEKRVDAMMADGLLNEVRMLLSDGIFEKNSTATQAIGYKEMLGYIRGEATLEEAVETLKCATRRYAKRQMTWFSAKKYVTFLDAECDGVQRSFDEIASDACRLVDAHGIKRINK